MKKSKYEYFCNKLEILLEEDSDECELNAKSVFREIIVEMKYPYAFILPETLEAKIIDSPATRGAYNDFKMKVKSAREKRFLEYYPYFDWQSINPKKYVQEFLLNYGSTQHERIKISEARIATMGSCFAENIAHP